MGNAIHEKQGQHLHPLAFGKMRDAQLLLEMLPNRFAHLDFQNFIRPPAVRHARRQAHAVFELDVLVAGVDQIDFVPAIVLTVAGEFKQIGFVLNGHHLAFDLFRALDIDLQFGRNPGSWLR